MLPRIAACSLAVRLAKINLNNSARTGLDSGLLMEQVTQADSTTQKWFNQSLCKVNDCVVSLGVVHGEFHWHHHDEEDELFFVIRGRLVMELRDRSVTINPGELFVVPRGVEHRPVAQGEVHLMLFEPAGTVNTGNVRDERTVEPVGLDRE